MTDIVTLDDLLAALVGLESAAVQRTGALHVEGTFDLGQGWEVDPSLLLALKHLERKQEVGWTHSVKLPLKSKAPPMMESFWNPLIIFNWVLFAI